MAFKMRGPSLLKMGSALKKKTDLMVPTAGPTDGTTETGYEDALRGLSPKGTIKDVIKRREERKKRGYDEYGEKIGTKLYRSAKKTKTVNKLPTKK